MAGLAEACEGLGLPVVGGNVSLYNETPSGPIYPTPVIGMVGELPDIENCGGQDWQDGDWIALAGPFNPSLAGSELEKSRGMLGKGLPDVEIEPVKAAIELVRDGVRSGRIRTVSDVSDGGIATRLSEMALASGLGCDVNLEPVLVQRDCSPEDALFGEGPGGFVIAGDRQSIERLGGQGVEIELLGRVSGNEIRITAGDTSVDILVAEARAAFESLPGRIEDDLPPVLS